MGQGLNHEDIEDIQDSLEKSDFCSRILSIPGNIFNYVWSILFFGPGVGRIYTERRGKHRIGRIDTSIGTITAPVMKIPCFDLTFGFFLDEIVIGEGLYEMDEFWKETPIFPRFLTIQTIETYWLLNYRRPKDIRGKKEVMCYIINEIDGLIYLRKISNNDLIDYEGIYIDYEEALESKELVEKEMVKILRPTEVCFNENCTSPSRKEKDL